MAQRRMFSLQIVDSDAFLDMPTSSQLLYFHLSMRADDDGFIGNPKKIMRVVGANDDDMKVLISKRFILIFKSGVIVIKHWKMHNYIQNDRYHGSQYVDEKDGLITKDNGSYTERIQDGYRMETEVRLELGKDRLGKASLELGKSQMYTPAEEAFSFFQLKEKYQEILEEFSKENDKTRVEGEFKKFIFYWTEKNKTGTRQRWEQEKTFEVKRRIVNWLSRSNDYGTKKITKII